MSEDNNSFVNFVGEELLKKILMSSRVSWFHETDYYGIFPFQVEVAPLVVNVDEDLSVQSHHNSQIGITGMDSLRYRLVLSQSLGQNEQPEIGSFRYAVYPTILKMGDDFIGLRKKNNREIVNHLGETIAEFSEKVEQEFISLPDDSFAALKLYKDVPRKRTEIITSKDEEVRPFESHVGPSLQYLDGKFYSLHINSHFLLSNDFQDKDLPIKYEPHFKYGSVGGETGRFVRFAGDWVAVSDDDCRSVLSTNTSDYGMFPVEVAPESLTAFENHLFALDLASSKLVVGLAYDSESVKKGFDNNSKVQVVISKARLENVIEEVLNENN